MNNTKETLFILAPCLKRPEVLTAVDIIINLCPDSVDYKRRDSLAFTRTARLEGCLRWRHVDYILQDSRIIAATLLSSVAGTPNWLERVGGIYAANKEYPLATPLLGCLMALNQRPGGLHPEVEGKWLPYFVLLTLSEGRDMEIPARVKGELCNHMARCVRYPRTAEGKRFYGTHRLRTLISLLETFQGLPTSSLSNLTPLGKIVFDELLHKSAEFAPDGNPSLTAVIRGLKVAELALRSNP